MQPPAPEPEQAGNGGGEEYQVTAQAPYRNKLVAVWEVVDSQNFQMVPVSGGSFKVCSKAPQFFIPSIT